MKGLPVQVRRDEFANLHAAFVSRDKSHRQVTNINYQEDVTIDSQSQGQNGYYRIKYNFNHMLLNIHIETENNINNATLLLNEQFEIPFTREIDNTWSIVFSDDKSMTIDETTTLPAAHIDCIIVKIQADAIPGKVKCWAKYLENL